MEWIESAFISSVWGMWSTHFAIQVLTSLMLFAINLVGFLKGRIPRQVNVLGMGVALFQAMLFAALFGGGYWLVAAISPAPRVNITILFWLFAALSALFVLPQIPSKLRKGWRNATIPGSLDEDIVKRKLGQNPELD